MLQDYRPLIGIPAQTLQVIEGIPAGLPHSWVMNSRYFDAVLSAGGVPIMVPLLKDEPTLRLLYERLDGVFLAGGVDVAPQEYGEPVHPLCGVIDRERDRVELAFTRWALDDGRPILGVCRGMQVLNVATGGTLLQDCAAQHPDAIKHDYFPTHGHARDYLAHEVVLVRGTRTAEIYGAPAVRVNSMHHQAVAELGAGLLPSGYAPDRLIEALEMPGEAFVVGVQWHPEMLIEKDAGTRRLFAAFIDAARAGSRDRTAQPA